MIKKTISVIALLSCSIVANAVEFEPFGVEVGITSKYYPNSYVPEITDKVTIIPPYPVEYFNKYTVNFNYNRILTRIEATGVTNNKSECLLLAMKLHDIFKKTYSNQKTGYESGMLYAYTIKKEDLKYNAYIGCRDNIIHYGMYVPKLEKVIIIDDGKKYDSQNQEINL